MAEPAVKELQGSEPGAEIIWRAFELRPEPVPTLDPGGEYLRRVWEGSVYPLAERLGVTMRLPPLQPRSRLAHAAARWARSLGRFDDYHAALFRAFFERGEDIGDPELLAALAAGLGMDGGALLGSLSAREFEAEVIADEREAEELGVSAVPAFVADRRAALSGVQDVSQLKRLLAFARTQRP